MEEKNDINLASVTPSELRARMIEEGISNQTQMMIGRMVDRMGVEGFAKATPTQIQDAYKADRPASTQAISEKRMEVLNRLAMWVHSKAAEKARLKTQKAEDEKRAEAAKKAEDAAERASLRRQALLDFFGCDDLKTTLTMKELIAVKDIMEVVGLETVNLLFVTAFFKAFGLDGVLRDMVDNGGKDAQV